MKADTLKRIIRAIADGAPEDLGRLARIVVEAERKSGHTRLADELESILNRAKKSNVDGHSHRADAGRGMQELPQSRRHGELLVTFLQRESLEHHMVLPAGVEERFKRIEREFAARERLGAYGLRPRKTVLLYGPPGCGKSLGAKRLAWNTGLPLMKVKFDALLSSYFGESASNLRVVFETAKERPCVLLLDECDFIARSRVGSKDVGEAARIVNTLLQLMEEYDAPGLLVATTNVERALDSAIFRRFDDVLLIPPPGQDEIDRLLKLTLSAVQTAASIDWRAMVAKLNGSSAADVVKVAMEAAKTAILHGQKVIEESHLNDAIREVKAHRRDASTE
jgi:SpoVK/Ycf46/Vps4 family AAA+-type ATPase